MQAFNFRVTDKESDNVASKIFSRQMEEGY
jgi:hypothetical protein